MLTAKMIAEGRFALVDIESTGLSSKTDQAIKIAFGIIDCGITRLRGYYTVQPTTPIKPGAEDVHGISMAALMYSPTFDAIAVELRELIGDRIVIGYGAKTFDVPILSRQFREAGLTFAPGIIDVLRLSKRLYPGIAHRLEDMTEHLGLPLLSRHDPWHDCKMCWQIFGALANRHPEVGEVPPSTLVEYAKGQEPAANRTLVAAGAFAIDGTPAPEAAT